MTKKKKLKIKKKNFTIFIIFLILICFCFTGLTSLIIRNFSNEKTKSDEKTFTNNKDLSEKDKKLKKLGNINKKISYFKMSNLDRYITYKEKKPVSRKMPPVRADALHSGYRMPAYPG